MVSGALPLPSMQTTKVGPGDKQRAYIVRQNVMLKALLAIAVTICVMGMMLCCTYLEVRVQRRATLHEATEHREEEHTSHMRIMRLSMLLEERLEDEVHMWGLGGSSMRVLGGWHPGGRWCVFRIAGR